MPPIAADRNNTPRETTNFPSATDYLTFDVLAGLGDHAAV